MLFVRSASVKASVVIHQASRSHIRPSTSNWLTKFRDLVLIEVHELCLDLLVVVVDPVHGTLNIGLVLMHNDGDDIMIVAAVTASGGPATGD